MLIINDFFARKKEAISNQMELLANSYNCKIISATRFMKQKAFKKDDLEDNIYVYPSFIYPIQLIINLKKNKGIVHLYEEEPSLYKEMILNLSERPLYISLYRRPSDAEIRHLKKYKYLVGIFVELEKHKKILINNGIDSNIIHITPTPSKFQVKKSIKIYNPNNINILFASWNMAEGRPLYDRGLIYLLDLLALNDYITLTVILRDNKIKPFIKEINKRRLKNRVKLCNPENDKELYKYFKNCDYVAFPAQKRIVKDVPNSLIDGLSCGKPIIISDILDFSEVVAKEHIGFVIKNDNLNLNLAISEQEYRYLSNRAFDYSKKHSQMSYVNSIKRIYKKNNHLL